MNENELKYIDGLIVDILQKEKEGKTIAKLRNKLYRKITGMLME